MSFQRQGARGRSSPSAQALQAGYITGFFSLRCRYAKRSRALFAGRLRFAEIRTHDFRASTRSSNRRSSSAVQLLWRRAAPLISSPSARSRPAGGWLQTARDRSALSPAGVSLIALPCFSLRLSIHPYSSKRLTINSPTGTGRCATTFQSSKLRHCITVR